MDAAKPSSEGKPKTANDSGTAAPKPAEGAAAAKRPEQMFVVQKSGPVPAGAAPGQSTQAQPAQAPGADIEEARRPCLYPWERILLNAQGQLSFCPSDWVHGSRLADYRETTILETWHGSTYAALRRAHLTGDYGAHGFCGQCPDWEATRWPHEGRSYADLIGEFAGEEAVAR